MIARMGKPKTNTGKKVSTASPKPVATAFSKGAADEKAAAEADKASLRREALKEKTAAMLAKKQARMGEQAQMKEDTATLNATAASLYGTDGAAADE